MKIILIGPPGSGKGTQAKLISEKYGILHISMGDLFRNIVAKGTSLSRKIKEIMEKGELISDEITLNILNDKLKEKECKKGFVLDGFPRTLNQANLLSGISKMDHVIYLDTKDSTVIGRLSARWQCRGCDNIYGLEKKPPKNLICEKCKNQLYQRDDDKPETIKKRLKIFHEATQPLIKYYENLGILRNVEGDKSSEDIFKDVSKILGKKI